MPKLVAKLEKYLRASAEQAIEQQQAHGIGHGTGKTPEQLFLAKKWFGDHNDGSDGSAASNNEATKDEATGDGVTAIPTLRRYPKTRGGVLAGCRSVVLTDASTQLARG